MSYTLLGSENFIPLNPIHHSPTINRGHFAMFFRRFSYQLPFTLRHRKSNDKLGNILPLFYGIGLKQQKKGHKNCISYFWPKVYSK